MTRDAGAPWSTKSGIWLVRRGLAGILASVVCLTIDMLLLFEPWTTSTQADVENDAWMHLLFAVPFIFVALIAVSDTLGSRLLRQGHRSIFAFMRRAGLWMLGFALALFSPTAIVAAVAGFGRPAQVIDVFGSGVALVLVQALPAGLAWRLVAGAGQNARASLDDAP